MNLIQAALSAVAIAVGILIVRRWMDGGVESQTVEDAVRGATYFLCGVLWSRFAASPQ